MSIPAIAKEVGVAKSSVSVWVRGLPVPEKYTKEFRAACAQAKKDAACRIKEKRRAQKKQRKIFSGDTGRWMLHAPEGYQGKTYIGGRYVYEHRYLMEQKLGRLLRPGEVVHHINGDKLDNREENLQLMAHGSHSSYHNKLLGKTLVTMRCPVCGVEFTRQRRQTFLVRKNDKATTCSRVCGSKMGHLRRKGFLMSTLVLRVFKGRPTGE